MSECILIPDRTKPPLTPEHEVFGADADIRTHCATDASQVPDADWAACTAILAWHDLQYTADLIERLDNCRVIVRIGVGFDNVNLAAAAAKGIAVYNVPDYGTDDVADHAAGMVVALRRGLFAYDEAARAGGWAWEDVPYLRRLTGQRVGIVGLGRIGIATAQRLRAFGTHVSFYDPYKDDGYDKALGIHRHESLLELAANSDIVSVHVPLTDQTTGMIGPAFFDALPEDALFVNTARGGTYDLDALYGALHDGDLGGAAVDVFPGEPPPADHPLVRAWRERAPWLQGRFIVTPHAAFYNREAHLEMRRKGALTAKAALAGHAPRNCVNAHLLHA